MDLRGGMGHPILDRLALRQRNAERLSLRRIFDHHVGRALRHANRRRGHLYSPCAEADLHPTKALPLLTKQLPFRDTAVLKCNLVCRLPAHR
jgi:hypothetical protein